MKIVEQLEQTLNGGYHGLYGEVVTSDCYCIKDLDFIPDMIFDIGANVGVFTRYARSLFPDAWIVAVEPHEENIIHFKKFTNDPKVILLENALGVGEVYHSGGAVNGAHEVYLSTGLGYPEAGLKGNVRYQSTSILAMSLGAIVHPYLLEGQKTLLKIDCEGSENCLWRDSMAMQLLRGIDYIAIELHYYGCHGGDVASVRQETDEALATLEATHHCKRSHVYFSARKKI